MGVCAGNKASETSKNGTDFVSFAPTALSKKRERVVSVNSDGEYIYSRPIPNFTEAKIDTASSEYRRALQDYNIKAKFNNDGTITVTSGGLFSRKQSFKTAEDFQKEANNRINSRKDYWDRQEQRIKSGRLTQLEAESIKTTVRNNTKSMAIKNINKDFRDRITEARMYSQAAEDMKRRLNNTIERRSS